MSLGHASAMADEHVTTIDVVYEATFPMCTHSDHTGMHTHMRWLSNSMHGVPTPLSRMEAYRRFSVECLRVLRNPSPTASFSTSLDGGITMKYIDGVVTVRKTVLRSAPKPGLATPPRVSSSPTIYGSRSKRQCRN